MFGESVLIADDERRVACTVEDIDMMSRPPERDSGAGVIYQSVYAIYVQLNLYLLT